MDFLFSALAAIFDLALYSPWRFPLHYLSFCTIALFFAAASSLSLDFSQLFFFARYIISHASALPTRPYPFSRLSPPNARAQVLKLRHLFRARDLGSVRIGSVDDYQVSRWLCADYFWVVGTFFQVTPPLPPLGFVMSQLWLFAQSFSYRNPQ